MLKNAAKIDLTNELRLYFFTESFNGVDVERVTIYKHGEEITMDKKELLSVLDLFNQYQNGYI